jgi:hypothetical protein
VSDSQDVTALARVRALLAEWDTGWQDMNSGNEYDAGYKTAWRERTDELRAAIEGR